MGKELFPWLTYKSKEQRDRERAAYAAWAFPHGDAQRDKVRALLAALLPKEDPALAMLTFLAAKEAYCGEDAGRDMKDAEASLARGPFRARRRGEAALYLALLRADLRAGPDLAYPSPEELRAEAEG